MSQIFTELDEQQSREALVRAGRDDEAGSPDWPRWLLTPLTGDSHELCGGRPDAEAAPLLLRTSDEAGGELWVVVCPPGSPLRVNGVRVGVGVRALADHDELHLGAGAPRVFFSAEGLPVIAPYDGVEGARCPRCRLVLEPSDDAVKCPACDVWHHQSAARERLCWSYAPHCALCPRETALDGGLRWVPEEGGRHG